MQISFEKYEFDLPDSWIEEACFKPFSAKLAHYSFEPHANVFLVDIKDVSPAVRGASVPIFNDGESDGIVMTAQARTVRILQGLMSDVKFPPVEVIEITPPSPYKFRLTAGCHRLHCAIAFGYIQIPSKLGIDFNILEGIQFHE